jgi:hypothetical protein
LSSPSFLFHGEEDLRKGIDTERPGHRKGEEVRRDKGESGERNGLSCLGVFDSPIPAPARGSTFSRSANHLLTPDFIVILSGLDCQGQRAA